MGSSLFVLAALATLFPESWAPYLWPASIPSGQTDLWKSYVELLRKDRFPVIFERRSISKRVRTYVMSLEEGEQHLVELSHERSADQVPRFPQMLDIFPGLSFDRGKVPLEPNHPAMNFLRDGIQKDQGNGLKCRYVVFGNGVGLTSRPDGLQPKSANPAKLIVRAVCPCDGYADRWSLQERYLEELNGELQGGAGYYGYDCVPLPPILLINLVYPWLIPEGPNNKKEILSERWPSAEQDLQNSMIYLKREHLPPWPIYVESKGYLRRAFDADMKYVSKGIFKLPD